MVGLSLLHCEHVLDGYLHVSVSVDVVLCERFMLLLYKIHDVTCLINTKDV